MPADRALGGSLPVRAYRYCEAICTASAYGWYIFTPMDFDLLWDVNDVYWRINEEDEWTHLESAQFPGFSDYFDSHSPNDVHGYAITLFVGDLFCTYRNCELEIIQLAKQQNSGRT